MEIDMSPEAVDRVRELVKQGRKIEAIKLFREEAGVDLKTAKEAVEAMIDAEGGAPKPIQPGGCGGVLLFVVVATSAAIALAS